MDNRRAISIRQERKKVETAHIVAETMIQLGQCSPELTYSACCNLYGEWFKDAVRTKKLTPTRIGKGEHGNRWFSVTDILSLKATELEIAELIIEGR